MRASLLLAFLPVAVLCAGFPALAADLDAKSKIDAVTVYPDAASVTRIVEIDLPAGATTLVFKGLPMSLDPASLRVEGAANGKLAIGSVEAKVAAVDGKPVDTALEARLKSLRSERETVQVTLAALEARKAMMLRFSLVAPEKLVAEDKPADVTQWAAAWEAVGAGLAKVGDDLRVAQARARELDEEIRGLDAARQRPAPRGTLRDVSVALEAGGAVKAKIALTYRIGGANWRALYDARLETITANKKPSLELVRRAAVAQRTGEDWTGVTLEVSTTRASRGTQAPDMQTQKLDFYEPPVSVAGGLARGKVLSAPASAPMVQQESAVLKSRDESAPPPPELAQEQQAAVNASAYQASFRIPGRIDVPMDGAQKTFRIASRSLNPDLLVKAVPALDETAYLAASFVNDEDAPLLAGAVALHRDGTFVGLGQIAQIAPGDTVDLGFGADDRVKVTRVPLRRKENEPTWLNSTKTESRDFKISVKNLHDFAAKITIIDQIPITENTAIVIEQLPQTTPPTEKIVADKRGVMAWTYDLQPNEGKDIRLAYRMKWPASREVTFQTIAPGR